MSRELVLDRNDPTFRKVVIVETVKNVRTSPGPDSVKAQTALRVHAYYPNKRSKSKIDHLIGTCYLRDAPDIQLLARVIAHKADELGIEQRRQRIPGVEPPANAA